MEQREQIYEVVQTYHRDRRSEMREAAGRLSSYAAESKRVLGFGHVSWSHGPGFDETDRMVSPFITTKLVGVSWDFAGRIARTVSPLCASVPVRLRRLLFPEAALRDDGAMDPFHNLGGSEHRAAMGEPVFRDWVGESGVQEAYQFTFLPSFDPPFAIRVWAAGANPGLISVLVAKGGGHGGLGFTKPVWQDQSNLDRGRWRALLHQVEESGFWTRRWEHSHAGLDGAKWIFQGWRDKAYRLQDLWSPEDGPERRLGIASLKLVPEHVRRRPVQPPLSRGPSRWFRRPRHEEPWDGY